jgi:hypothetical protein
MLTAEHKKGLQKRLSCWSRGDVSKFSPDDVADLFMYFLRNNQLREVQKGLRLVSDGKLASTGSMVETVLVLTKLLGSRGSEQDFQLPIFIFSVTRTGSIYIRDSLIKSFGYTQLRGFTDRPFSLGESSFGDFGGSHAQLNGLPGFITNCHLFPSAENLRGVARLSQRAHLIFLLRHPLGSLFSYFYRLSYKPREKDFVNMVHASEDDKKKFLTKILKVNLEGYSEFYEGWFKILKANRDTFSVICYEDYEEDYEQAVRVICNKIGLDPNAIRFAEKNSKRNYQKDVRPDFLDVVPATAFEQYAKVIENFTKMREFAIRDSTQ